MWIEKDQVKTLLILAVVIGGFVGVVYMPHRYRVAELQTKLAAAEQQIRSEASQGAGLTQLAAEVAQLQRKVSDADKVVPPESELAALLKTLSTNLARHQVQDQAMQTQPMELGDDFYVFPVRLSYRAPFREVHGFLQELDHMAHLVHVSRLELDGDASDPSRPLVVQMDLAAFFAPDQ